MDKDTRINVKVKLWLLQYKELKENTCIPSTERYHSRKCERELSDDVTFALPLILTPSFSEIAGTHHSSPTLTIMCSVNDHHRLRSLRSQI